MTEHSRESTPNPEGEKSSRIPAPGTLPKLPQTIFHLEKTKDPTKRRWRWFRRR